MPTLLKSAELIPGRLYRIHNQTEYWTIYRHLRENGDGEYRLLKEEPFVYLGTMPYDDDSHRYVWLRMLTPDIDGYSLIAKNNPTLLFQPCY